MKVHIARVELSSLRSIQIKNHLLQHERRDTTPDEWIYHLFSYLRETPEYRFNKQKMAPLDHDSSFLIRGLDKYDGKGCNQFTGCVPAGGQVTVQLEAEGVTNPVNLPVRVQHNPLIDTGGHDHLNTVNNQVRLAFGGFVLGQAVTPHIQGRTDANGVFTATFRAENSLSQYSSASGFVDMKANMDIATEGDLSDQERLTIRMPGLVALLGGANYALVGGG